MNCIVLVFKKFLNFLLPQRVLASPWKPASCWVEPTDSTLQAVSLCVKGIIKVDGDRRKAGVSKSKEVRLDERRNAEEEMSIDKIQTDVTEPDGVREKLAELNTACHLNLLLMWNR